MDNSVMNSLSQGLDLGSARISAISNNLTNVNTPGYKRKEATFDALLKSASDDGSGDLTLQRTDARHLSSDGADDSSAPAIVTQSGGAMRADGNNVDVDAESGRLAAAQIYYEGVAQMMAGQFTSMKYVISGGA